MFRRQNSTNKQKISKDSKTIETWWNMPIEFSSNQLNDVCSLFQCPPYKVVPPKRYKLVYKPHEYYRYITNKNHNEIGVINLPTEHYRLGAPPCNIHPWPHGPMAQVMEDLSAAPSFIGPARDKRIVPVRELTFQALKWLDYLDSGQMVPGSFLMFVGL